ELRRLSVLALEIRHDIVRLVHLAPGVRIHQVGYLNLPPTLAKLRPPRTPLRDVAHEVFEVELAQDLTHFATIGGPFHVVEQQRLDARAQWGRTASPPATEPHRARHGRSGDVEQPGNRDAPPRTRTAAIGGIQVRHDVRRLVEGRTGIRIAE